MRLGHEPLEVRTVSQLNQTRALIIPGGESTTLIKLIDEFNLRKPIREYSRSAPVMGTCAGLIILASQVDSLPAPPLNLIDINVIRNAYGRQKESFIDNVEINLNGKPENIEGVFIRAPLIKSVHTDVKVLARYKNEIVMAENKNILVCSFHPEISGNTHIHNYFLTHFVK